MVGGFAGHRGMAQPQALCITLEALALARWTALLMGWVWLGASSDHSRGALALGAGKSEARRLTLSTRTRSNDTW